MILPLRRLAWLRGAGSVLVLPAPPAAAQPLTLDLGDEASSTGRIVQLIALLTVLSLAPGILVTWTSVCGPYMAWITSIRRNSSGRGAKPASYQRRRHDEGAEEERQADDHNVGRRLLDVDGAAQERQHDDDAGEGHHYHRGAAGAIAHGHPIGATGAVLTTRLLHSMRRDGLKRGVVTLCIGGGQGIALALESPA